MNKSYKTNLYKKYSFVLMFLLISSPLQAMDEEAEKQNHKNQYRINNDSKTRKYQKRFSSSSNKEALPTSEDEEINEQSSSSYKEPEKEQRSPTSSQESIKSKSSDHTKEATKPFSRADSDHSQLKEKKKKSSSAYSSERKAVISSTIEPHKKPIKDHEKATNQGRSRKNKNLEREARAVDPDTQYEMFEKLLEEEKGLRTEGKEVEANEKGIEARKWLEKAAKNRHTHAQFMYGFMSYKSATHSSAKPKEAKEHFKRAIKWLKRAAEHMHEDAVYYLGKTYFEKGNAGGSNATKNYTKAIECYSRWYGRGGGCEYIKFKELTEVKECSEAIRRALESLEYTPSDAEKETAILIRRTFCAAYPFPEHTLLSRDLIDGLNFY